MEIEICNLNTGATFKKVIKPIKKAMDFIHKAKYSNKTKVLSRVDSRAGKAQRSVSAFRDD